MTVTQYCKAPQEIKQRETVGERGWRNKFIDAFIGSKIDEDGKIQKSLQNVKILLHFRVWI